MYLKTREIAERLAVVPNTIKALIQAGELPAIRVGKQYRVHQDDFQDYLEAQRVAEKTVLSTSTDG